MNNTQLYEFKDENGRVIQQSDYVIFKVKDDLLSPMNIKKGNLILCQPISFYEFKKEDNHCAYIFSNDYMKDIVVIPLICKINIFEHSLIDEIKKSINEQFFNKFRSSKFYKSDEYLLNNIDLSDVTNCKWVAVGLIFDEYGYYKLKIFNAEKVNCKVEYAFTI